MSDDLKTLGAELQRLLDRHGMADASQKFAQYRALAEAPAVVEEAAPAPEPKPEEAKP